MNISISTYHIKKSDTLLSIADRFGVSVDELRKYHNTYCDIKNLIGHDLKGVHEIIIPPSEKIEEFKKNRKEISLSSNLPSVYLTKDFYTLNYEAEERFEELNKEPLRINYLVSVELREMLDKGFVAEVKTSKFKKDRTSSDDKISMLSLACTESIFPLRFIVPVQGKIKGFYEHKAIVKKFEEKRPDLEFFFIGEVSDSYLNKFHTNLKNESYLLKQFQSVMLYQVLFPEMDWFRRKKEWEENFYVIPNSFPVKCQFHTEYNYEDAEVVEIIIKGKIVENCSLHELLKGVRLEEIPEEKIAVEINLCYHIYKKTKQLFKIETNITLLHEGELYLKHNLLLTAKKEEKKIRKFSTLVEE